MNHRRAAGEGFVVAARDVDIARVQDNFARLVRAARVEGGGADGVEGEEVGCASRISAASTISRSETSVEIKLWWG